MKPDDFQAIELVLMGWVFGVMTCILYVSISNYVSIKRRNRTHRQLLDAGMDPLDIMTGQGYPFNPDYGPEGVQALGNEHVKHAWRDKNDHEWQWMNGQWRCRRGGMWLDHWEPSEAFGPFTVIRDGQMTFAEAEQVLREHGYTNLADRLHDAASESDLT